MSRTRHGAVWNWLLACPHIRDLFFNFSASENGDTVLVPLTAYKDVVNQVFISGFAECWYDFTLVRFEAISYEANDVQNMEVLCDIEGIAAWVEQQAAENNFPEFPDGCQIQSITALPSNIGYVSARDETGAKYMLEFRIEYIREAS